MRTIEITRDACGWTDGEGGSTEILTVRYHRKRHDFCSVRCLMEWAAEQPTQLRLEDAAVTVTATSAGRA